MHRDRATRCRARRSPSSKTQIEALRARIARIPYLDPIDLRFRNRVRVPVPTTKAVMFCLMDVSGSMDEARKDLAKRFFILLYLFLTRHYEKIDIVFIRHHTQAQEVDEQNFFHATETGGTVVSSALVLMDEIIRARYSPERVEHLRRAGQRRRQLAPRQRPLPRVAGRQDPAAVPLLRLRAGGRGRAEPVGGVRAAGRARSRTSRCARRPRPSQIYPVFRDLFKKEGAAALARMKPQARGATLQREPLPRRRRGRPSALPAPSDWTFELIEQLPRA